MNETKEKKCIQISDKTTFLGVGTALTWYLSAGMINALYQSNVQNNRVNGNSLGVWPLLAICSPNSG